MTPAGRAALTNLLGLSAATAASQACMFGLSVFLALVFGPEQYGVFAFTITVQVVLVTIGTAGLQIVVVRDLGQRPDQANETLSGYFALVLAAATVMTLVAALAVATTPEAADERLLLLLVVAGNLFACLNLSPLFDAYHRQALSGLTLLPADAAALLAVVAIDHTVGLTLPAVGMVLAGRWVGQAAAHLWAFRRIAPDVRWSFDRSRTVAMLRSGFPMLLNALLVQVIFNGGVILARFRVGDAGAGLFGLGQQFAAAVLLAVLLVSRILVPHVAGPYGLTRSFVRKLVVAATGLFAGLVAAAAVAGAVVFRCVLGPEYGPASDVFLTLLPGAAAYGVTLLASAYLLRLGREWTIHAAHVIGAGVFLALAASDLGGSPVGCAAASAAGFVATDCVCVAALIRSWPSASHHRHGFGD